MKETTVDFRSGELVLEGVLAIPEGDRPFPAAIICHPHPLYGGSMDNNVVYALTETLTQSSFVSFRFNFRGVGGSQGEFGQGIGEQEDVEAAIAFMGTVKEVDSERMGLAGYSAGAGFAFPVGVKHARIGALAAVSPAFDMFDFSFLKDCHKPKLLVLGSKDNFVTSTDLLEFCRTLPDPKECEIIEGADHSWSGYESRMAAIVTSFFVKVL
ncbi:MAG: dienelactone hydrolase family protein [Dehalococcoidia bacterium]|nr:dienelactone hydrolase family protein [Dehalococcoidia bacterium]MDH4299456.1 dienelactone hydrolase family protein [Dehalococcoidia bacterium]MDH4366962.1 dienelactone hydrolase family protein [Dehalococcoidia bacterium]